VTKLANVACVPTPKAAAAVLVCKHKEVLAEVASSILEVNEAGQDCLRQNLYGEVDHSIKNVAQGAVHDTCWLDDPPVLGHVGV
jgi:hypothetical protein